METSTSRCFLTLLILLSITSEIVEVVAIQRPTPTTTTIYTEFIRKSCRATTYPDLCYNSLSIHASVIQTNPHTLANAALSVTLDTAQTTSAVMSRMSKGREVRPREASAMRDCLEILNDSVVELRNSIKEMGQMRGSKSVRLLMNDVQTWVSAALTDENTCMEGFDGKTMDGSLKTVVRGKIVTMCHLTSNSLALINNLASLHG